MSEQMEKMEEMMKCLIKPVTAIVSDLSYTGMVTLIRAMMFDSPMHVLKIAIESGALDMTMDDHIRMMHQIMGDDNRIQLIKTVRLYYNLGLKEAKDAVDKAAPRKEEESYGYMPSDPDF